MFDTLDPVDRRLLDGWQRDLPLETRPFAAIGARLALTEADVLDRLKGCHPPWRHRPRRRHDPAQHRRRQHARRDCRAR